MASNIRTFTITQARMGEPLQFQPALGSKELEDLVDAYVIGSASKQDKLSEVTLEFFNLAQVDIYTGLLTRHYTVTVSPNWTALAFERSPTQSQSSGFSPPIYTPSPASSMTFADSGYGSISMTPPTRTHGAPGRVTKKAKKDTKKAAEVRLPGFSIMTKDGVDVTSSAGRGTKTKEQREHAHLMRIMKACDDCKRKKIRCDPSHRRQQTDMSRSSTSTTSCSRPNRSPPVSVPSLSRATTQASPPELPSFGNNAIDDFVLFPEDSASSWNPAEMSFPEYDENLDLSQFNFDINGLNDFPPMTSTVDQYFDMSPFDQQPATDFQFGRPFGHDPFLADQNGYDQYASAQGGGLSVSHSRPHHSISSQDSGQLDSNIFDSLPSVESSSSQTTPSSQGMSSFNENLGRNGLAPHPQISQSSSVSLPSAEVDWSLLEAGILPSPDGGLPSLMNRRERRNRPRLERTRNAAIQQLVDSIPSTDADEFRIVADALDARQSSSGSFSASPADSLLDQSPSPGATAGGSLEYWGLESTRALVTEATQALKSTPAAYQPIYEELQRLRGLLEVVKSGDTEETPLRQAMISELVTLTFQLEVLLTRVKNMLRTSRVSNQRYNRLDPEFHPDFLCQSAVQTRRLVSALCATINSLQTHDTGIGGNVAATNSPIISSGNFQLAVSPPSPALGHPQDAGEFIQDGSFSRLSSSDRSMNLQGRAINSTVIRQAIGKNIGLEIGEEVYEGEVFPMSGASGFANVDIATIDKVPTYRLVTKPAFERLSSLVDGQSETIQQDIFPPSLGSSRMESTLAEAYLRQVQVQVQQLARRAYALTSTPLAINPPGAIYSPLAINTPLDGDPTMLSERERAFRSQLATESFAMSVQNVGSSGSDSPQSESSSPGAIPGIILENRSWYNSGIAQVPALLSDGVTSSLVLLASLVLLNYLQATTLMLPLAALFLVLPNPTPIKVAMMAFAVVACQSLPFSSLMVGLKYLVTAALTFTPMFKQPSNRSSGGILSLSKKLSTPSMNYKDTSLLALFNELSLGHRLSVA